MASRFAPVLVLAAALSGLVTLTAAAPAAACDFANPIESVVPRRAGDVVPANGTVAAIFRFAGPGVVEVRNLDGTPLPLTVTTTDTNAGPIHWAHPRQALPDGAELTLHLEAGLQVRDVAFVVGPAVADLAPTPPTAEVDFLAYDVQSGWSCGSVSRVSFAEVPGGTLLVDRDGAAHARAYGEVPRGPVILGRHVLGGEYWNDWPGDGPGVSAKFRLGLVGPTGRFSGFGAPIVATLPGDRDGDGTDDFNDLCPDVWGTDLEAVDLVPGFGPEPPTDYGCPRERTRASSSGDPAFGCSATNGAPAAAMLLVVALRRRRR